MKPWNTVNNLWKLLDKNINCWWHGIYKLTIGCYQEKLASKWIHTARWSTCNTSDRTTAFAYILLHHSILLSFSVSVCASVCMCPSVFVCVRFRAPPLSLSLSLSPPLSLSKILSFSLSIQFSSFFLSLSLFLSLTHTIKPSPLYQNYMSTVIFEKQRDPTAKDVPLQRNTLLSNILPYKCQTARYRHGAQSNIIHNAHLHCLNTCIE